MKGYNSSVLFQIALMHADLDAETLISVVRSLVGTSPHVTDMVLDLLQRHHQHTAIPLLRMALSSTGCRILQHHLRTGTVKTISVILDALQHFVLLCINSPHGNFVIQAIIEFMHYEKWAFIAKALETKVVEVARHEYGCRIICRMVEQRPLKSSAGAVNAAIDELLTHVSGLINHRFAHHAVEAVLQHGTVEERSRIAEAVINGADVFIRGRYSKFILERVLVNVRLNSHLIEMAVGKISTLHDTTISQLLRCRCQRTLDQLRDLQRRDNLR
jgi:hypothetical protein